MPTWKLDHRRPPRRRSPALRRLALLALLAPLALLPLLTSSLLAAGEDEPPPRLVGSQLRRIALTIGLPRRRTVTFVHRVKNASPHPLRQVEVALAVPRTDDRQSIHSVRFSQEPARRTSDGWDQELAHFVVDEVPPGGEAEVRLTVDVALRDLHWLITGRDVGALDEVPARVRRHYLKDGDNYRLDEALLRRVASRIPPAAAGVFETIRGIHDLVVDSLEYCRDDRWDPADRVLREGKGSCSEYAYLMIALCRLQGIPARYAGGTWIDGPEQAAHVDRVFHRWVEVYLPRVGWFPIDPTEDDRAERAAGEPYRYFGRLPWRYLTLLHGDGDRLESGPLGWDYRSSSRWSGPGAAEANVVVERYAVWTRPEAGLGRSGLGN
ncbi:MAG: transglutaminase domain-containing protein [Planctomycetes bacterium]|nr:transglutaminase domain-containing protein [Planctomycetota bacterium]